MKPEGSLPVSRAPPPTDPYAVPDESSWHPPILVKIQFNIILLSVHKSFKWSLSFKFSNQNTGQILLLSHACHMLHPCHHLWFSPPNIICHEAQKMKLLIMQLYPASCSFPLLSSKYFPAYPCPCIPSVNTHIHAGNIGRMRNSQSHI